MRGGPGVRPATRVTAAILLTVAGAAPALGMEAPHLPQEVTVETLEGGRILVRNPAPPRGSESEDWRLVEELRLG